MWLIIVLLLLNWAIAALFVLAGYLTGRMVKRPFTAVLLLVLVSLIPISLMSRLPLRGVRTVQLLTVAIWAGSIILLTLAGYAISRARPLGWAVVCLLCLMQSTYLTAKWFANTQLLYAVRWHQVNDDRVRIGPWEFVVPRAWYPRRTGGLGDLGVTDMLELQRVSLSSSRKQPNIFIFSPLGSMARFSKGTAGTKQDTRFHIQGEYGDCSLTENYNNETRYSESCRFPNADLYVTIDGQTEEDLDEAADILSGGRLINTSDPHAIRQPS